MNVAAETNALSRSQWVARIASEWRRSVDSIFEVGRLLAQAKAELPHGEWGLLVERDLPFGARTAQRLMQIAKSDRLQKHRDLLPPVWSTMSALAQMGTSAFERAVSTGIINPEMERNDIRSLRPHRMAGKARDPLLALSIGELREHARRHLIEAELALLIIGSGKPVSTAQPVSDLVSAEKLVGLRAEAARLARERLGNE